MKKRKSKWYPTFASRPANFVLRKSLTGSQYYVSKRHGVKGDSDKRESFVSFFANEADAWLFAENRVKQCIERLMGEIKHYRKARRKVTQK